ncbi:hypothetical protein [Veillonella infantium]|uniref:Yip1 domain-containing protein n=1 Tax=Veillonella infantium TaxID=1911679 RepID=A0ABX5C1U5_9FIRM|nr:hypothetical protein [Veillonella infantium]PQL57345.1 hypothetical protein VCHSUH03_07800 [Veillonella infantium]
MKGLFGAYIEKWMHLVTIKNMLLLAIGSLIITDLGLYILMLLFPKSPFFKTLIWEVISPVELEVVSIIGYVLGIAVFILVTSCILYGVFKVFKGQVTYKQLVADLLLSSCIASWIHLIFALVAAPTYLLLDLRIRGGTGGLSTMELFNVFVMAQLMSKQFGVSPWITGISFYIVSFIFGAGGIMLFMTT